MADTYFQRSKKDKDYTVMDNTFIRDSRLSWKSKGVMSYLLSLPEDWKIYISELKSHSSDGETSLRSALTELEKYGYLRRVQLKEDDGKFSGSKYEIIENPDAGKRDTVFPDTGNQSLLSTNIKPNTNTTKMSPPSRFSLPNKLFNAPDRRTDKDKKKEKWIHEKEKILGEYDFSDNVQCELCYYLDMLADLNALHSDITIRSQLKRLTTIPNDSGKIKVIKDTIARGWKSLDYAINDCTTRGKGSFDTAKNSSNQFKSADKDTRSEKYTGQEKF
jgi:hypothetical protein